MNEIYDDEGRSVQYFRFTRNVDDDAADILARMCEIKPHEINRFEKGKHAQRLWDYLERRSKLTILPSKILSNEFIHINKSEIVKVDWYEPQIEPNSKKQKIVVDLNKEERSDGLCSICMERKIDCVILWCGHISICLHCANNGIGKKPLSTCPICNKDVYKFHPIFFSN